MRKFALDFVRDAGMAFLKVMPESALLTRQQVANVLSQSLRSVDQLIAKGEIEVVRIGRSIRIRPSALELFIESRCGRRNPRKPARKKAVKAVSPSEPKPASPGLRKVREDRQFESPLEIIRARSNEVFGMSLDEADEIYRGPLIPAA